MLFQLLDTLPNKTLYALSYFFFYNLTGVFQGTRGSPAEAGWHQRLMGQRVGQTGKQTLEQ